MKIISIFIVLILILSLSFASTQIDSCQTLSASGEYDLNTNISGNTQACFDINANNITLNGNEYSVSNQISDYNAVIQGHDFNNLIIKNFNFVNVYSAINLAGDDYYTGQNNLILNNSFLDINSGEVMIYAEAEFSETDLNLTIQNNTFIVPDYTLPEIPLQLAYISNAQILNNSFDIEATDSSAINLTDMPDTNIYSNTFTNNAATNSGWINSMIAVSGITLEKNVFQTSNGRIYFNQEITLPSDTTFELLKTELNILPNNAIIDSNSKTIFVGESVQITLNNIPSFIFPNILNNNVDCITCTNIVYSDGGYSFTKTLTQQPNSYGIQRQVFKQSDLSATIIDAMGGFFAGFAGLTGVLIGLTILIIVVFLLYDLLTGTFGIAVTLKDTFFGNK